jgi:NAD(P)H-hydrate epimerase
MREIDRAGIEDFGIPGVVLMENAGRGASALVPQLSRPSDGPILVVAGRGNNGGDGFVCARHLHNQGYAVRILHVGSRPRLLAEASDAGTMARIVDAMGLPIVEAEAEDDVRGRLSAEVAPAALVIDGLLGTGLAGEVRGAARVAIDLLAAEAPPLLALDLPSGLDANTGAVLGAAVRATVTATFGRAKLGLLCGEGPAHAGRVEVIDIGLPRELLEGG